ncbi:MAG: alkaline phosphatase family protein [Planctomycetota bacterium]
MKAGEEGGGAGEFRDRLKSLGYLDNPLDKFFIGGAHGRTGLLAANLKIAVKVGVLGGIFLGVVTMVGFSALAPEAPSPLVLAKLAACFSLVFAGFFTAFEFVIGIAVSVLGRAFRRLFTRTEMIGFYSAVFAGLTVLSYGTLWWWAQAAETSVFSGRAAAAFLIIALAAAVAAFLTRRAVMSLLALLGGADLGGRGKGRGTKLYAAVLVLGLALFAGYRLATAEEPPRSPSDFETDNTDLSVTLVAVDGASVDFLEYLISEGALANLSAFVSDGFVAPLGQPVLHVNPSVWTTAATGVTPEKHGVTAYSGQEIAGLGLYLSERSGFGLYDAFMKALPAVGLSRRAPLERRGVAYPQLWDIVALKGELSGVVNWWGTWPAGDFHGFLVTDRMYPKLQVTHVEGGQSAFEEEVYPEALFNELASYPLDAVKLSEDAFRAAADIDRFAVAALLTGSADYPRIALRVVYLPGLDIYTNSLEEEFADEASPSRQARIVAGATEYWRFLDSLLQPLLALRGGRDVVMIAADPGMLKGRERRGGRRSEGGFLAVAGGPVKKGTVGDELTLADIAPTALYVLGFPRSAEMDGHAAPGAFEVEFGDLHPPRTVETYGRVTPSAAREYSVDRQLIERLRSLGYLQR